MTLRTKAAFWLTLTFLVGGLLGGGLTYLIREPAAASVRTNRTPPSPEEMVAHLDREAGLSLTPEQVAKLEELFRQRGAQMEKESSRSREEIRRIRTEADQQIRALLTPEQLESFEVFKQEWRKRHPRRDSGQR